MKSLLVVTLMIAMLVQTFSKAVVMADFYLNQEDIVRELCENKDKPKLQCEGHCQLKKELEKKNTREIPEELKEIKVYLSSEPFVYNSGFFLSPTPIAAVIDDNRTTSFPVSVFHPPA